MQIKGRNWWGKRPKNSWSARNKMHSSLKRMMNGVDVMSEFKVVQTDDRVEVFCEGVLIGECESYELDAICELLRVDYEDG